FLESFEQHRAVRETWSLGWTLRLPTLLLGYGPVGLLAACRLWRDRRRLDEAAGFFVVCFAVSFLLANHEWFLPPRQPLHFTRGYLWMPLCLLALPLLQRLLSSGWFRASRIHRALLAVLACCAVSDNVGFLLNEWRARGGHGYFLTPGEREMYAWIEER